MIPRPRRYPMRPIRATAALERRTKSSWDLYNAQLALMHEHVDQSVAAQSYMRTINKLDAETAGRAQISALQNLANGLTAGSELRTFLDETIKSLKDTARSGRDIQADLRKFIKGQDDPT